MQAKNRPGEAAAAVPSPAGATEQQRTAAVMLSPMDSTVHSSGDGCGSGGGGGGGSDGAGGEIAASNVDYRKKRIKNVQKLELVRLMKANFLFIRGKHAVARCEKSRADVWKMITTRLNNLGPPVQSAEAWQRRWNDMRSATKSKMAKIQNYVREHGEECPYKLNLVERLIWDTFSVKPEEYMKDLNMKWWREKHQHGPPATVIDGETEAGSLDAPLRLEGSEAAGRSGLLQPTAHEHPAVASVPWPDPMAFGASSSTQGSTRSSFESTGLAPQSNSCGVGADGGYCATSYSTYQGQCSTSHTPMMQTRSADQVTAWQPSVSSSVERTDGAVPSVKPSLPSDVVAGSRLLRDLNKLFDLVLKQNEEILNLLRQSCSEN